MQKLLFYLVILFLPTQLGKHFWPDFSYVQGIRVDYLSPTLYITDILIFSLFILWMVSMFKIFTSRIRNNESRIRGKTVIHNSYFLILPAVFLLLGIVMSRSPLAGWYGLLKLFEFCFLGIYVAYEVKFKKDFILIATIFSAGVLFESFLAIAQFINKGSIGGLFYFFGERTFNAQTPGIANASLDGQVVLRPYGTFSHPNVLAGHLTIALAIVISNFQFQISNFKKIMFYMSLVLGSLALLLAMSRVTIALWLVIVMLNLFIMFNGIRNKKLGTRNKKPIIHYSLFIILLFVGILILSPISSRFANLSSTDESVVVREKLVESSFAMIKDSPVFGVGINNFLINLPFYQKPTTTSLFTYLQPVHNIFFLIATQTGIVGLSFFAWFIFITTRRIKNEKFIIHNSLFIILFIVLVLGMFDHYFLTLQQGQLLFAFVLGLSWAKKI